MRRRPVEQCFYQQGEKLINAPQEWLPMSPSSAQAVNEATQLYPRVGLGPWERASNVCRLWFVLMKGQETWH